MRITTIVMAILLSACGLERDPAIVRAEILADAGLTESASSRARAEMIRDLVYRSVTYERGGAALSPSESYYAITDYNARQLCGGISMAYAWALLSVGVEARTIQLLAPAYLDGSDPYATHVSAEVYYDGAWHLSDPTFNSTFGCTDGGTELSIDNMRACIDRGADIYPEYGPTTLPGRGVEDYYIPYREFMAEYYYTIIGS